MGDKRQVEVSGYRREQPLIEITTNCLHCGAEFSYTTYATGKLRACCSAEHYQERERELRRERQRRYSG